MKSFFKSLSLAAALCVPAMLVGCGDDKTAENAKPIPEKSSTGPKDKVAEVKPIPPILTPAVTDPVKPADAKPPVDKPDDAKPPVDKPADAKPPVDKPADKPADAKPEAGKTEKPQA